MDKKAIIKSLQADFARVHEESVNFSKTLQEYKVDTINYIQELLSQLSAASSNPSLIAKTPKLPKKKGVRKPEVIPENEEFEIDSTFLSTYSSVSSQADTVILETSDMRPLRSKRGASVKAADIIKKQQSISLTTKLRRPSSEDSDIPLANRVMKDNGSKRSKTSLISSDEEDIRPSKQLKVEVQKIDSTYKVDDKTQVIINDRTDQSKGNETVDGGRQKRGSVKRKLEEQNEDFDETVTVEPSMKKKQSSDEPVAKKANYTKSPPQKNEKDVNQLERISETSPGSKGNKKPSSTRTTRSSNSLINAHCSNKYKMANIINETIESNANETVASMYEDAINKPIPIMNSTMNPTSSLVLEKMINVTVLIEPLSTHKKILDETVTIKKNSFKEPTSRNNSTLKGIQEDDNKTMAAPSAKNTTKILKTTFSKPASNLNANKYSDLLTDDESSPERKQYKTVKEKLLKQQKRVTRSSSSMMSDEDEVKHTPPKKASQNKFTGSASKSAYKQTALFSPYAKDSVKKRVEAFEQVATSPKKNDSETAGRVTRTKTRALAAASFTETSAPTVAQKLARKSLAKAKKISLAKHAREHHDDMKENENANIIKSKKSANSLERSGHKSQAKTTPLGKNRMLQMPGSTNKNIYVTPNSQINNTYSKTMTASRGNIVSHVDSFIQPNLKSASKTIDRAAEERRRKAHEEDARRKREELLKAQAEEKRRKREEKELKNKLAREAKEKLEQEKRLKAEREREEKARLAQQMQEKQKEEMERKRYAQMQRALEKEERRKQEEMQRLHRLQEQEEQERQLAEQKRREQQEMEKRKQAEIRHMQAENKMKNQMMMQAKAKALAPKQVPTNYKIDSDPDEEESDDESKPKHQIPPWASKNVRQAQLGMQKYVPIKMVLRFFDAKKCTPDLRELFQGIDPKKLKRSSSAIWKTPPRYSMMNCSIIKDE